MRKRLLIGLLSAGLLGAMLPGVAVADRDVEGWVVFFICEQGDRVVLTSDARLWFDGWPPRQWRSQVDTDAVEEGIDYLATEHSLDCRIGGVSYWR